MAIATDWSGMEDREICSGTQMDAIRALDSAIEAHSCWLDEFNRALLCRTTATADERRSVAAGCCGFGPWYDAIDHGRFRPAWSAQLGRAAAIHRALHQLARDLIRIQGQQAFQPELYDLFTATARNFKAAIRALQFELINDVCLVDHLTGAWNRNSLLRRISEEHDRARRSAESCCLCMMDLDHFKTVNDAHGHAVGDSVLKALTKMVLQRLRSYDALFRYGGEEFLMCLPKTSMSEAVAVTERIRADIAESPLRLDDGVTISITASFGIAELSTGLPVEQNIDLADRALFRAKAAGRNQVCC